MIYDCEFISCVECARRMITNGILQYDYETAKCSRYKYIEQCRVCAHGPNSWKNPLPIEMVEKFSNRLRNALIGGGIHNCAQLLLATPQELASIRCFGAKSYDELQYSLGRIEAENLWEKIGLNNDGFNGELLKQKTKAIMWQRELNEAIDLYYASLSEVQIDSSTVNDNLLNEDEQNISLMTIVDAISNYLEWAIDLQHRNSQIFCKRIGLIEAEKTTLQALGEEYGITRERVRQICNKAIRRSCRKQDGLYECRRELFDIIKEYTPSQFVVLVYEGLMTLTNRYFVELFLKLLFQMRDTNLINELGVRYYDVVKQERKNIQAAERQRKKIEKLASKLNRVVVFPGEARKYCASLSGVLPKREVCEHIEAESGETELNKCIRPVQYESKLELNVLLQLDCIPWVKEINTQCIEIPYEFDGREHIYYPDIVIKTQDDRICILECKPMIRMAIYQNIVKFRALHQYCHKYGFGYAILDDRLHAFKDILDADYSVEFAEKLQECCLKYGYLKWRDILRLANESKTKLTATALTSIIVQRRMKLYLYPYRLSL